MALKQDGLGNQTTVIGESILISGKLSGDEDLLVRGRVEGELSLTKTLIVEQSGIVKANVTVKNAIVSGVVVGNISATESVELTREGRMVGDIRAPRVIVVDGASFRGRVDMGEVVPGQKFDRPPRPTVRPVMRSVAPPPRPPPAPSRVETKPAAKGPDKAPAKVEVKPSGKPSAKPPPPPPAPPTVAEVGKKKVVVKRKG